MGTATLGSYAFRLPPSGLTLDFSMDTNVQQTVGGRVVQIYGATFGDLVIRGDLGQRRQGGSRPAESWELHESFVGQIKELAKRQQNLDPLRFTFSYDDQSHSVGPSGGRRPEVHSWDLDVYIKSLSDGDAEGPSVIHATGKFAHTYVLTLFVVKDRSDRLIQAGQDAFIERLADGVGWKPTKFNGGDLQGFLSRNNATTIQGALRNAQGAKIHAPAPTQGGG